MKWKDYEAATVRDKSIPTFDAVVLSIMDASGATIARQELLDHFTARTHIERAEAERHLSTVVARLCREGALRIVDRGMYCRVG